MIKYQYNDTAKVQEIRLNKFESIDYSNENDLIHQNHSPDALNIIRDNNMKFKVRDGLKTDFLEEILQKTDAYENLISNKININDINNITFLFQHGHNFIFCIQTGKENNNTLHSIYQILYQIENNRYSSSLITFYQDNYPTGLYKFKLGGSNPKLTTNLVNVTNKVFVQDRSIFIISSERIIKLTYFEKMVWSKNYFTEEFSLVGDKADKFVNQRYHYSFYPYAPKIKSGCALSAKMPPPGKKDWYSKAAIPAINHKGTTIAYPNFFSSRCSFTINEHLDKDFYHKHAFALLVVSQKFIEFYGEAKLKEIVPSLGPKSDISTPGKIGDFNALMEASLAYINFVNLIIYYKKFNNKTSDFEIKSTDVYTYDKKLTIDIAKNNPHLIPYLYYDITMKEYVFTVEVDYNNVDSWWLNDKEQFINNEDTMYIEFDMPNNISEKFGNILQNIDKCCLTTYGNSGNLTQLIISANSDSIYRNCIFFSQYNDFNYFPITNYFAVGDSTSAITGFNRTEFGLVVHKDIIETRAYVLEFGNKEVNNQIVSESNIRYVFPSNMCVSKNSCENLNESLYLSNIGIQGIIPSKTMNQNIIQVSRGERINNLLFKEETISDAIAFVFKTFYMLALQNKIYILDMYSQQRNFKSENLTVENNPEKYQLSAFYWEFPEIKRIKYLSQFESGITLVVTKKDDIDRIYQLKDTMNFVFNKSTKIDTCDWYWYTRKFEGNGTTYKKQLISTLIKYRGGSKDTFKVELVIDQKNNILIPLEFDEITNENISDKKIISNQIFNNLAYIQFKISNTYTPEPTMDVFTMLELNFKFKERGKRVIPNE